MGGCYNGYQAQIKQKAPYAVWNHCIIHKGALASISICTDPDLDEILQTIMKIVKVIKTGKTKSRCFEQLCLDMELIFFPTLL